MAENREPDFTGWATKNDMRCSDGRTIKAGAFKHMDQVTVPLVWMHQHTDPENVLGHALLEDRAFGTYTKAWFNDTPRGQHMKGAVQHGDVQSLSIYANNLSERKVGSGKEVYHGDIKEVSLVLAGANPGALIENINIVHGDVFETLDEEAIIYTGLDLQHSDTDKPEGDTDVADADDQNADQDKNKDSSLEHAEKTAKDVFEELTEEQQDVMYHMLDAAYTAGEEAAKAGSDDSKDDTLEQSDKTGDEDSLAHNDKEGTTMGNVFDQDKDNKGGTATATLSHSQQADILEQVRRGKGSLKHAIQNSSTEIRHADTYGVDDIEMLFPDARTLSGTPGFIQRKIEWVDKVLGNTNNVPFARVKTIFADITADEARAKGYIKGTQKKDEVIKLLQRTTGPATVYKKQKLDRDDILDITSFDIVAWLKAEIRMMLNEEIARAILVGDGRAAGNPDKIKDPEGAIDGVGIRSIANDHELYAIKVELAANVSNEDIIDEIVRSFVEYRGTGTPTFFTTHALLVELLLLKDRFGRRLYDTVQSLSAALGVREIVTVPVMNGETNLLGIIVNLTDYTVGTNSGGQLTFFSNFDIDFNQEKYLMETRLSGGLTVPYSAIVLRRDEGTAVSPVTPPSFDAVTNTITIPTTTGIIYTINDEPVTGNVVIEEDTQVVAKADTGYYIPAGTTKAWNYTYTA